VSQQDEALGQYRPVVQYDSLESYYTDSAGVITDRPGNVLKRVDGSVLAAATAGGPSGDVPVLTLGFLRPDKYPTGETALPTDYVDETGKGYVQAALEMHAKPGYANKVHGRMAVQNGVTWLQYWFFMYYDDPGFLNFGTHEGDIEMIQLRLDAAGQPQEVSYAQHRSGVRAPWSEVEQQQGAPVVYSARGTHASMLRAGTLVSDRSFLPDHNDNRGPRVRLELVTLTSALTPWAFWPGFWGSTRPPDVDLGKVGIEASSPNGLPRHRAWQDPAGFHASCEPAVVPPVGAMQTADLKAPPTPALEVTPVPERGVVRIKYAIPDTAGAPATGLVIGVGSPGEGHPPATTVIRDPGASGEIEAPLGAGPVEVRATTHSEQGAVSDTAAVPAGPAGT
jgi:hypothetical protein